MCGFVCVVPSKKKTLCNNSADGIKWLDDHGLKLPVLSQCGGHSAARTHRPTSGAAGGYITLGLCRRIQKLGKEGKVDIRKQAKMERLIKCPNSGAIVGLEYKDLKTGNLQTVKGAAVIISTGGFCYNKVCLSLFFF